MSSINFGSSFFAISQFHANTQASSNALERLSTGFSINRASDNPAGMIAAENFITRLNEISSEITSIDRNISNSNIQDGALGSTLDNLADLDGLVIQGANEGGLSGSEIGAIQTQVQGVLNGISHLGASGGSNLLSDVTTEMVVGTDELTGDDITETVSFSDLASVIESDPEAAQRLVDGAREAVLERRAEVGVEARASETERRVLEEEQINIARTASITRDADYARESSNLVRSQILSQASVYTVLASNQNAQTVLSLLDIRA
ncbi:MAG: flagellin [Phycisphaerales bacterium]|jgi:flagellin|nr:flagellin [Phycisphaerales bacterium]